jgi:hypothetical protein
VNAVDFALVGYCVSFDEPSEDGRPPDRREDYEALADFADELPLLINHFPFITLSGFQPVGRCRSFAVVYGDPYNIPSGVLCYAELDRSWLGVSVLAAVSSGQLWAMSLGGNSKPEVSLTDTPAFQTNRILGCGPAARTAWDLLVPGVAPDPAEMTNRHSPS